MVLPNLPSWLGFGSGLGLVYPGPNPNPDQVLPNLPSTPLYAEQFTGYGKSPIHQSTP